MEARSTRRFPCERDTPLDWLRKQLRAREHAQNHREIVQYSQGNFANT
jgi:hypothetical protein